MKVLTIKEPWATLIISGYKMYEFRSWKTNYRGKILIHAGMSLEEEYVPRFKEYDLKYSSGAIIGEDTLTDCILVNDDFNRKLLEINPIVYETSGYTRNYAWKFENVIKYEKTIPCRGKLGLWNYDMNN